MHLDKAPGPWAKWHESGFFQTYWDIVGEKVMEACLDCLQNFQLPEGLNDTTIVLILRKAVSVKLTDLRPISLCIYKIIVEVLANKLKHVLPSVILDNQSVFIPGRLIMHGLPYDCSRSEPLPQKEKKMKTWLSIAEDGYVQAYNRIE